MEVRSESIFKLIKLSLGPENLGKNVVTKNVVTSPQHSPSTPPYEKGPFPPGYFYIFLVAHYVTLDKYSTLPLEARYCS